MTSATITLGLLRQYQRNIFLLLLLVTVPFVFITLSFYNTESMPIEIYVTESGSRVALERMMPEVHASIMVPIAVSFLAGIVGLFVMLDAAKSDSRLLVAGLPAYVVASSRLAITLALSLIIALVSIAVTLINFSPGDLLGFLAGNVVIGISYAWRSRNMAATSTPQDVIPKAVVGTVYAIRVRMPRHRPIAEVPCVYAANRRRRLRRIRDH
jgi:hypothetical protein